VLTLTPVMETDQYILGQLRKPASLYNSAEYPRVRWPISIAAVFSYTSMRMTNLAIVPILLPHTAKDLHVDMGATTNLMTAFLISASVATPFPGIVRDGYGVMVAVIISALPGLAGLVFDFLLPKPDSPHDTLSGHEVKGIHYSHLVFSSQGQEA
jgi:MFS family permease